MVKVLGYVPLYYIYYTLQIIGSHGLPFGVRALMIYDACVCTAPVPSVLPQFRAPSRTKQYY